MQILSHSEFIPVFFFRKIVRKTLEIAIFGYFQIYTSLFEKIVRKNLEQPFLAIPNLYQSFWGKLLEKIWNSHFWPFQIYTSLFGKNCWKKFGTAIFGHSKFIPVFLRKIVGKNLEQPFLAIPNLYQSFWGKLLEKNLECPFLAILNLYQSFWKKFRMAIFGHSEFVLTSFLYISL